MKRYLENPQTAGNKAISLQITKNQRRNYNRN